MEKIKIGEKEYKIDTVYFGAAKKIIKEREKLKLDSWDATSYILAEVINLFNPDAKMTIKKFDETVPVAEFEEIQKSIMDISGLDKYFKLGVGKKS